MVQEADLDGQDGGEVEDNGDGEDLPVGEGGLPLLPLKRVCFKRVQLRPLPG